MRIHPVSPLPLTDTTGGCSALTSGTRNGSELTDTVVIRSVAEGYFMISVEEEVREVAAERGRRSDGPDSISVAQRVR